MSTLGRQVLKVEFRPRGNASERVSSRYFRRHSLTRPRYQPVLCREPWGSFRAVLALSGGRWLGRKAWGWARRQRGANARPGSVAARGRSTPRASIQGSRDIPASFWTSDSGTALGGLSSIARQRHRSRTGCRVAELGQRIRVTSKTGTGSVNPFRPKSPLASKTYRLPMHNSRTPFETAMPSGWATAHSRAES